MFALHSFVCGLALTAFVDAQITLGTAGAYGVFAASTITNTGLTIVNGKLGLSPGTAITGFPPGVSSGQDISDGAATTAKTDIQNAYNALVALPVNTDLTGQNLGGLTLTSGVYGFSSSGFLTGILTLDAQGDPNALFVFKFGSTLITASVSSVVLLNGAQGCNVFWQVGSSATLGTGTVFVGNILAEASITATTGVVLNGGGLYALTAAVTLDTNTINPLGSCGGVVASSSSTTSTTSLSTPTTSSPTLSTSTASAPTTTSTTTITVTNPTSTTTITLSVSATITVTSTVSTTTSTCTSTKYSTSTKTTTCATPTCTSTSLASSASSLAKRGKSTSTKTKTLTTTCAKYTSTYSKGGASATSTKKTTHTETSTKWHTNTSTTTTTHTPSCTAKSTKARRDYQRMFA